MAGRARKGRWARRWAALGLSGLLLVLGASFYVELRYSHRIRPLAQVPAAPVALVFGAGLAPGGVPSQVLGQRLDAAVALYRAGKVQKLLVSGDNTDPYHDETKAMRRYALDRGVPPKDVVGDWAGVSTYDSCYRAHAIFGVDRATLVTQDFHLPRALFLANSLGMDAWGVPADAKARRASRYRLREVLARAAAAFEVVLRPRPQLLGPKEDLDGSTAESLED